MEETNRFNLIDEKWIPVTGQGYIGLKDVFSEHSNYILGGTPIEKIALMKLFLAIAQRAKTPKDVQEYVQLTRQTFAEQCSSYLEKRYDDFYLYGKKPFLQMKGLKSSKPQPLANLYPYVASGNNVVLKQSERTRILNDGQIALIILTQCGFGFGGKKTDNDIILSPGHLKKSGQAGALLGAYGYLHSFYFGGDILESVMMNLITEDDIKSMKVFSGLGIPPWEEMPKGEICEAANALKNSLMGTLVPMSRFMNIIENQLHYTDGVPTLSHKNGWKDTSISIDSSKNNDPKALWANVEKRPWRQLTALLSFMDTNGAKGFDCPLLRLCGNSLRLAKFESVNIWAGGIAVSSNSGEQYCSGTDDYVESLCNIVPDSIWFSGLQAEMEKLENILSKYLYGSIVSYHKKMNNEKGADEAKKALHTFWQLCEKDFQELIDACNSKNSDKDIKHVRAKYARYAETVFNSACPKETARQIAAWGECSVNTHDYLSDGRNK